MKASVRLIFVFAPIAMLMFCLSPGADAQDLARMEQAIRSHADETKSFMGAVLVARERQVLLSRGYGSANLEWNVPNTPATKFRLGSVTKQFTATAILLLEERGKLRTDDPVKKHMPDAPPAWDRVTIFHLLTHTSGIPSFTSFPEYRSAKRVATTPENLVASFRDSPLEFAPGEKWNYSNSGYVLLGYLIEKVSGQTYEAFVQEHIFAPLGMNDSGYDSNAKVIPRRAAGYSPSADGWVNADFIQMSIPHAAGALYSTTEDLLLWTQGLFGGKLLSPASLEKMTTPFKNDYALGLVVRTANGRRMVFHNGSIEGFNSSLAYFPESKLTIAVLGNVNGPGVDQVSMLLGRVAHGEAVVLTTERKEITLAPEVLARYVGTYELSPTASLTITLADGRLMGQLSGQRGLPLFAESELRFFLKVVDAQVEFIADSTGAVTHAVLHQGGRDQKAARQR
jgi:CubicO group peptidase (beta-lactamase class C family)